MFGPPDRPAPRRGGTELQRMGRVTAKQIHVLDQSPPPAGAARAGVLGWPSTNLRCEPLP